MPDLYLANSHRWLYREFTEKASIDADLTFLETRRAADLILYATPPWPDHEAPEPISSFRLLDRLRFFVFSQEDVPFQWAPGMYASIPSSRIRYGQTGGFYVPNNHHGDVGLSVDLEAARAADPDLLWSFVGTMSNHLVRSRLAELDDAEALVRDTQDYSDSVRWDWTETGKPDRRRAHAAYAASIARSRFVVCPRGRGAGSIRLFEAMQAGRCPVIISDAWVEPPFVDWERCSVRVAEKDIESLPMLLRERERESSSLGAAAREVWENLYSPERRLVTLARASMAFEAGLHERVVGTATAPFHRETALLIYRRARKTARDALGLAVER